MQPDDLVRLQHMLESARAIRRFVQGRSRDDLETDMQLTLALVKAIEIVGEAANQMAEESRSALPDIPWEDVIGMRHRLVHAYFDINLDILWKTAQRDVPFLIDVIEHFIESETA